MAFKYIFFVICDYEIIFIVIHDIATIFRVISLSLSLYAPLPGPWRVMFIKTE